MAELIEAVSGKALSDVDKLIEKLKTVNTEISNINNKPIGSGRGVSDNRQAISEIERLNRLLAEQGIEIQRLTAVRTQSNQRTQEEITNTRLLAQNANRAAQANSTFASSYQRLTAQQAIAASRVQDIIARGRTATQTQREYDRELRIAQGEFDRLNTRVLTADRAVGRFNRNVGNYPSQSIKGLKDLIGAFGIVGGVAAFAAITKEIFNTTRELQSLDLALKNVTGSQQVFAETQDFLSRISEAYGIEINGLTRSYTGFLAASKNAIENGDITARQIQDIFESVAKASGAMGLSVEQQQGAFLALQQMISKGNVQAEEIRGQLAERLPGAFGILAKSMGVTEQELNKLLKDGKVLAAEVLPAFAKELEKAYGVENLERVESLAASTTRLGNAWTELIRSFSEGDGIISKSLSFLIDALSKILKGYEFIFQNEKERLSDSSAKIYNDVLRDQAKYYEEIGVAQAKVQAAGIVEEIGKRVDEIERENITLEENIKLSQEAANLAKKGLSTLNLRSNAQMRDIYAESNENITKYTDQIKKNTMSLAFNKGLLDAAKKVLEDNNKAKQKAIELTDKERKALEKAREEELQNQYRLQKLILESEQRGFEQRANDASLYYAQREEALADMTNKEIALAELARKEGLRKAKNNKTLQLIVWEEYYKDYEGIIKESIENEKKLREKAFEEFVAYKEKYEGEGLKVLDLGGMREDFFKKQAEDAEKLKERLKDLRNATDDYLKSIREGFLSDAGLGSLNMFFDQTLDPLTGKMQSTFDKLWEGADSTREKFQVAFTAISEVVQEAFNFINQQSQARFDAMYENLKRQEETELMFAGKSEEGRAEIERQYDEKRREIKRKEAESNKENAIFNAIINTAQAVVAALPNYALSIIVGAIGAAQIALIASQPIPQYKMGTDNHKGGLAIVGDGGKHEAIFQPSLGWSVSPNKSTLVDLEKGSKVFPDLASSGVFDNGLPDTVVVPSNGITQSQMDILFRKHMPKQSVNVEIGKGGLRTFVTETHSRTEILNDTVRIRAKKI